MIGVVAAFAIGWLIPFVIFACVMATIQTKGEALRAGYGYELHKWWASRPSMIDVIGFGVCLLTGLIGLGVWYLVSVVYVNAVT